MYCRNKLIDRLNGQIETSSTNKAICAVATIEKIAHIFQNSEVKRFVLIYEVNRGFIITYLFKRNLLNPIALLNDIDSDCGVWILF